MKINRIFKILFNVGGILSTLFFVSLSAMEQTSVKVEDIITSNKLISKKRYELFSENNKKYLTNQYEEAFKPIRECPKNELMRSYSLSDEGNVKSLIESAKSLIDQYKKSYLFGLGQSPAWLIETARLLDPASDSYRLIAFSGCWFSSDCVADEVSSPYRTNYGIDYEWPRPKKDAICSYRKYLTKIGLSPAEVIERFEKTGKNTIILEYAQSGNGLASFLSVLKDWSIELGNFEKLQKALEIHLLKIDKKILKYGEISSILGFNIKYSKTLLETKLIKCLGDADDFDDRLVPNYEFCEWTKLDPLKFGATRKTNLIRFRILDVLYKLKNN
jgi:hypothetical protein